MSRHLAAGELWCGPIPDEDAHGAARALEEPVALQPWLGATPAQLGSARPRAAHHIVDELAARAATHEQPHTTRIEHLIPMHRGCRARGHLEANARAAEDDIGRERASRAIAQQHAAATAVTDDVLAECASDGSAAQHNAPAYDGVAYE